MRVADGYVSKVKFSVTIYPDTAERLDQICRERRIHRTRFIEDAIQTAMLASGSAHALVTTALSVPYPPMVLVPSSTFDQIRLQAPAQQVGNSNPEVEPQAEPEPISGNAIAEARGRIEQAVHAYVSDVVEIIMEHVRSRASTKPRRSGR